MDSKDTYISDDLFSSSYEGSKNDTSKHEIIGESAIIGKFRNGDLPCDSRFTLKTEAHTLKLAHANNKLLSLSNSRTRILAHQVESTHIIVSALNHRFLIADEVGLGKTIEGGLVIKEMIYRYNYQRIIIVAPATLLIQWQNELQSKFNEEFIILDRKMLKAFSKENGSSNPWKAFNRVICSIDFIKNSAYHDELAQSEWDMVIIDEAHRLRRDAQKTTQAYHVAEILSNHCSAFLLLTATPFRGKLEELYFLIKLVDKNLLGPFQSFSLQYCSPGADLSALREKISKVVIRRTKNDIGGFTKRHARTIRFELYPEERELYDETNRYVAEEFNRAMQAENRAVGFIMTVFQKLLDSSSYALLCALRKRAAHLNELIEKKSVPCQIYNSSQSLPDYIDDEDEYFDEENLDEILENTLRKNIDEIKEEVATLNKLIGLGERIDRNKKGEKLLEMIRSLHKRGEKKFLIFTQFKTTQDYLYDLLSEYKVVVFHGSMNKEQKEEAIIRFKKEDQILICTEAGGEGRNMQFCRILFNYDLPWSPLKIEQRIGRLHRFGQADDVLIYNFATKDTVAERVLEVLTHKVELFEESLGKHDILLGQIDDEVPLNRLFMEMAAGCKTEKKIVSEVNERLRWARESYAKLSELTVAKKMDFNYDEYYRITLKEREFSNKRIEKFMLRLNKVDSYPGQWLDLAPVKEGFYRVHTSFQNGAPCNRLGAFDSTLALNDESVEFLAFGHPIIDNCIEHCQHDSFGGDVGIKFLPTDESCFIVVFNYLFQYTSVSENSEIIPILIPVWPELGKWELESIARDFIDQENFVVTDTDIYRDNIDHICKNIDYYAAKARDQIFKKTSDIISDKKMDLDLQLDPELEKITIFYDQQLKELEEQLHRQENQMRVLGKDMKSAIARTQKKIESAIREKNHQLARCKRYQGMENKIQLISAGILIGTGKRI